MTHKKEIQDALNYIEKNLCEELSLDEIAAAAGFSKFYFHRVFQSETGMPVYDYIRKRRLADWQVQRSFCALRGFLSLILQWLSVLNPRKLSREPLSVSIIFRRADIGQQLRI